MSQQVKVYTELDFKIKGSPDSAAVVTPSTIGGGITIACGATARAITGEAYGVAITYTGTLSSGDSMVGLNVVATAVGSAASWVSGLFVKCVQASKVVNGYLCAAEFELASTAALSSDNAVVVINSVSTLTSSPPAAIPYILLREYGASGSYGNCFVRIFNDTGQAGTTDGATLYTTIADGFEANANCAIRCMKGSTAFWLLGTTTTPEA